MQAGASLEDMQTLDGHALSRKVMAGAMMADAGAGAGARPASGASATGSGFDALGSAQLKGLPGTAGGAQSGNAECATGNNRRVKHTLRRGCQ